MACSCNNNLNCAPQGDPKFKRALWIALLVNVTMFFVEVIGGAEASSVSLWADAVDFAGDSANYAISLFVLPLAFAWRSRTALMKGIAMTTFGLIVLAQTVWSLMQGTMPEPSTMTMIGLIALVANASVAWMLFKFKDGDANMRSVWLCSRNDAIGNLAVIAAAAGVSLTGSQLPDAVVAVVMASMALHSGLSVIKHARTELQLAV